MTSVLRLLEDVPPPSEADPANTWFDRIEESLDRNPQDWNSALARVDGLSEGQGWSLLSWIEVAATKIGRTGSPRTLATAAFAMSLVLQSPLDQRDCAIVASLLRRASARTDLDFSAGVAEGCGRAGEGGRDARPLLEHSSPGLPSTHVESGAGHTFMFRRAGPQFDVDDLERWLEG